MPWLAPAQSALMEMNLRLVSGAAAAVDIAAEINAQDEISERDERGAIARVSPSSSISVLTKRSRIARALVATAARASRIHFNVAS
jgi:hypothetical protein